MQMSLTHDLLPNSNVIWPIYLYTFRVLEKKCPKIFYRILRFWWQKPHMITKWMDLHKNADISKLYKKNTSKE